MKSGWAHVPNWSDRTGRSFAVLTDYSSKPRANNPENLQHFRRLDQKFEMVTKLMVPIVKQQGNIRYAAICSVT
jgi:hypothetical protein